MSQFRRPALLVVCLVLLTVVPMTAQTAPAVASEVHHDSSASLRSMVAATAHLKPAITRGEHAEFEGYVKPIYNQSMQDSAVQTSAGAPVGTTAGLSFAGIGQGDYNYNVTFPAPDSNGAVGATQYVHSVASSFAVFDKSTGALLLGPANINSLFAGFGGPCESAQAGDSVVVYDRIADRWVVGTMAQRLPTGEGFSYSCIAVSQTSDATGAFNRYSIKMSSIDYQKIGVWPDAYYVGLNNPQNTTSTACALDRTSMLQGGSARPICFNAPGYNTLLPSDLDGRTLPPAGSPNYFVGGINAAPNVLNLFKFHVDFTNSRNSTFTGPIAVAVAPYTPSCATTGGYYRTCVPQKSSATKLETLSDRLMYRNAYRNFSDHEALVVNHTVDVAGANGHAVGIRWYELRAAEDGNFSVFQQGTYAPDSNGRFMGSIAMDHAGDIALGYGVSSAQMYPSIAYTGRTAADAAGKMEGEKVILNGGNSTNNTLWGDYTNLAVDPVDDCTFWYTSQYYKAGQTSNWSTQIASFKFNGCK